MSVMKSLSHQQKNPEQNLTQYLEKFKIPIFLVVLTIGFLLRITGIRAGLPYSLNLQETEYLSNILSLIHEPFKIHFFEVPSFFLVFNSLITFICSGGNVIYALEINPQWVLTILRLESLVFSVSSIVLIYMIGEFFGSFVGIFASAFLAVSFLHVKQAQFFSPVSALTFFTLLSVFFILKAISEQDEKKDRYYLFSLISSLTAGLFHFFGLFSLIPVFISSFLNKDVKNLKKYLICYFSIFIILNPYSIFTLYNFLISFLSRYSYTFTNYHFSTFFLSTFTNLITAVGPFVYFAAVYLIFCREEYDDIALKILFFMPLLCIGIFGFCRLTDDSYVCMLIPFICLSAGLVFNLLSESKENEYIFIVMLLLALWIPFKYASKYNKTMSLADTRILATEWINEKTNEEFKIIYDKNSLQLSWFDPFSKSFLKKYAEDPDLISNPRKFELTSSLLSKKSYFKIIKRKVDYIVVDSYDMEKTLRNKGKSQKKDFYKKLRKLTPFIAFNPYLKDFDKKTRFESFTELYLPYLSLWNRERSGPVINVYKI